jgi:hypothetical protein
MLDIIPAPWRIVAVMVLAGLVTFALLTMGYSVGATIVRAEWTEERLALAKQALAAEEVARAQEQAWQDESQKSQEVLRETLKKLADTERAGRVLADGLRGKLAAARQQLSAATPTACARVGNTLADIFGSCASEYLDLARRADECVAERNALIAAWPEATP